MKVKANFDLIYFEDGTLAASVLGLSTAQRFATAKAIAHRVNCHDELVAALKGAQRAIRKAIPLIDADGDAIYLGEWLDTISAAIKRAEQ